MEAAWGERERTANCFLEPANGTWRAEVGRDNERVSWQHGAHDTLEERSLNSEVSLP